MLHATEKELGNEKKSWGFMFQEKATFRIWQKNSFPMQHKEAAFDKNDPITSGSFKQLLCFEELSSAVGVYNSTCKECLIS